MKKLMTLTLAAALSLCACNKSDKSESSQDAAPTVIETTANEITPTPSADLNKQAQASADSAEFTEEGLKAMFKTAGQMSADEFEALMLSFAKCEYKETETGYNYAQCPANKVYISELIKSDTKRNIDSASQQAILLKLAKHENKIVRDKALGMVSLLANNAGFESALKGDGLLAGDSENINAVLAIAKEEKDPKVFYTLFERLLWIDNLYKNRALVDFIIENSKNENAFIRKAIPQKMAAFRMKGIQEAPKMILDMCQHDSDEGVRREACADILDYDIPNNLKLAQSFLKDPAMHPSHGDLIKALANRCYDWPSHEKTDAAAYEMIMDYYKTVPRSENVPYWATLTVLKQINDKNFDAWKAKATYYNADELVKVMSDIITDSNANWLARTSAIDIVLAHGGKEALQAVLPEIEKLKANNSDKKAEMLIKSLNDKLAQANK